MILCARRPCACAARRRGITLERRSKAFDARPLAGNLSAPEAASEPTVTQHSRNTPQFYLTAPSPCPYLPGHEERKVFTHLVGERAAELNDLLTHGGFRRV